MSDGQVAPTTRRLREFVSVVVKATEPVKVAEENISGCKVRCEDEGGVRMRGRGSEEDRGWRRREGRAAATARRTQN